MPKLNDRSLFWEVKCERNGQPYCSSVVQADSEKDALRRFHEESALADYVEPVEVTCIGLTTAIEALLSRAERRSPRSGEPGIAIKPSLDKCRAE